MHLMFQMNVEEQIVHMTQPMGCDASHAMQTDIDNMNMSNDNSSDDEEEEEEEEEGNFDQQDTSDSDNEDPAGVDNGDNTDEESIDEGGGDEGEDDEGGESSENEAEEYSMSETDERKEPTDDVEEEITEESPVAVSKSASPVEGQKRGRGRPKKILNNSDILDALDESFQEKPKRKRREVNYGSEEGSEGEEDNEEEEMEEELPSKRQRYSDEVIRRSGRERKAPKKFEAVLPQKKKRKKKFASSDSEDKSEEDSDEDYSSHRKYSGTKKKKKRRRQDKFNIYKKSPTKVKRKQKKLVVHEVEDSAAALTDESDNEYSRSWRKKMKKKKGSSQITAADYGRDKKSSRVRKTTKYQEEDTSHESDLASDRDSKHIVEAAVEEEDIETIEFVLDHRVGKVGATGNSTMFWAVQDHGDPNTSAEVSLEESVKEQQYLIKWKGWSHINNTW